MNKVFAIGTLMVSGLVLVGCGSHSTGVPSDSSVTDVSTPAPAPAAAPAYTPPTPVAAQPVTYDTMPAANSGAAANSGMAMAGGSYTVKRGDTLYSIARKSYGDGKQWQKIAAANPGLRPESLKVGQTITIP